MWGIIARKIGLFSENGANFSLSRKRLATWHDFCLYIFVDEERNGKRWSVGSGFQNLQPVMGGDSS